MSFCGYVEAPREPDDSESTSQPSNAAAIDYVYLATRCVNVGCSRCVEQTTGTAHSVNVERSPCDADRRTTRVIRGVDIEHGAGCQTSTTGKDNAYVYALLRAPLSSEITGGCF